MPQYRRRPNSTPPDPAEYRTRTRQTIRNSVDVGADYTSMRAQLQRLGHEGVRRVAARAGVRAPSARTLRRWSQQDRVPHAQLAHLIQRADQVQRAGGVRAAARQWGRSESTVRDYQRRPTRAMRPDAANRARSADLDARRQSADIPSRGGRVTAPATVTIRGEAHISGPEPSAKRYAYERERTVTGYQLDLDTTQAVVEARERGDEDSAKQALEQWLGTHYAPELDGWSESHGWHWTNITDLELAW